MKITYGCFCAGVFVVALFVGALGLGASEFHSGVMLLTPLILGAGIMILAPIALNAQHKQLQNQAEKQVVDDLENAISGIMLEQHIKKAAK